MSLMRYKNVPCLYSLIPCSDLGWRQKNGDTVLLLLGIILVTFSHLYDEMKKVRGVSFIYSWITLKKKKLPLFLHFHSQILINFPLGSDKVSLSASLPGSSAGAEKIIALS